MNASGCLRFAAGVGVFSSLLLGACNESPTQNDGPGTLPPKYLDTSYTDFSPLRVGNTWTYGRYYYGRSFCDPIYYSRYSKITIVVSSREQRGDTNFFFLTVRDSLEGEAANVPSSSKDTVVETPNGILPSLTLPFFGPHSRPDSVILREKVDFKGSFRRAYADSAMIDRDEGKTYTDPNFADHESWRRTFVQDVGLAYYRQEIFYRGYGKCTDALIDFQLRDFTPGPIEP